MVYSVVIPVYNSEKIVAKTIQAVVSFFETNGLEYQLILVNDNSKDGSWEVIAGQAEKNKKIVAINLFKNYGQHSAIFHGFKYVKGDYVITLDDDLQNPPSEMIHLIKKAAEGYDLVFGKFRQKQHHPVRKLGTKVVGYLNKKIFNKPDDITLTNFRIIKRDIIEKVIGFRTGYPYIPGLVLMFASKIANVEVEHHKRAVGESNYTVGKILQLIGRILFNYSSFPLRIASLLGFFIAFLSFIAGFGYIINNIISGTSVQGWTTLVVLISFLGGFIILMLGMVGEYLVRIMNEQSNRNFIYEKGRVIHE